MWRASEFVRILHEKKKDIKHTHKQTWTVYVTGQTSTRITTQNSSSNKRNRHFHTKTKHTNIHSIQIENRASANSTFQPSHFIVKRYLIVKFFFSSFLQLLVSSFTAMVILSFISSFVMIFNEIFSTILSFSLSLSIYLHLSLIRSLTPPRQNRNLCVDELNSMRAQNRPISITNAFCITFYEP